MTEQTEDTLDLQSLWDESDDDGVSKIPDVSAEDGAQDDDDSDAEDTTDGAEESEEDTTDGAEESEEATESEEDEGAGEEGEQEIDYQALWVRAQNEVKTMAGRIKAVETRLTQEKDELLKQTQKPVVSPSEEDEFLDKFKATYNEDVIKAIDLITTKKATQIVESTLQNRLSPIESTTNEMVVNAHFGAIETAHPDVAEIDASPIFESWLGSKPEHVRFAYEHVRNHGTPGQVISMLNEYKTEIGAVKRAPAKTAGVSKDKVAAATAVGRRRGTVQTAAHASSTDLASIWAETDD